MTDELFPDRVPLLPSAHARRSDPSSSEVVNRSLGADGSMRRNIWIVATDNWRRNEVPLNDTFLTEQLELLTRKRQQRNVVARCRDLMTDEGWFEKVGLIEYDGRAIVHFIPVFPTSS